MYGLTTCTLSAFSSPRGFRYFLNVIFIPFTILEKRHFRYPVRWQLRILGPCTCRSWVGASPLSIRTGYRLTTCTSDAFFRLSMRLRLILEDDALSYSPYSRNADLDTLFADKLVSFTLVHSWIVVAGCYLSLLAISCCRGTANEDLTVALVWCEVCLIISQW